MKPTKMHKKTKEKSLGRSGKIEDKPVVYSLGPRNRVNKRHYGFNIHIAPSTFVPEVRNKSSAIPYIYTSQRIYIRKRFFGLWSVVRNFFFSPSPTISLRWILTVRSQTIFPGRLYAEEYINE